MKPLFLILISVAFLFGCSDDNNEELTLQDEIAISAETILFNSSAISAENSVTVTSGDDWRLTGEKTWCIPSVVEGKSGDHVSSQPSQTTRENHAVLPIRLCVAAKSRDWSLRKARMT